MNALSINRRELLTFAGIATGGILGNSLASGIEPITRTGESRLRISIAAYSYRQWLDLKKKPKPEMTLADFIDLAAKYNLNAVELTSYYFAETTPEYLAALKGQCTRLGLDVSGTAVANNFCATDPVKVKQDIAHVKAWVEHTSRLGGKTIRIFAGTLAKGDNEEKARGRVIEAIQESCDYAAKFGIYLALENHGGITSTAEQLLAIVKGVKHPFFGVNLDSGNFHTEDPYGDLEKIAPYSVNAQIKTDIHAKNKPAEPADLSRKIAILRKANYRGYVVLEYEGKEDGRTAVPKYLAELKKLIA